MSVLAIRTNSSLSLKMSGCVKNAAIVGIGALTGDTVRPLQLLGYALSVAAFLASVVPGQRPQTAKKLQ